MVNQEKSYTPDQLKDVEKLCLFIKRQPEEKRQIFSLTVLAYINGFEAGLAAGQDTQAQTTG